MLQSPPGFGRREFLCNDSQRAGNKWTLFTGEMVVPAGEQLFFVGLCFLSQLGKAHSSHIGFGICPTG